MSGDMQAKMLSEEELESYRLAEIQIQKINAEIDDFIKSFWIRVSQLFNK